MLDGTTFAFISKWPYWRETWCFVLVLAGLLLKSRHLNLFLILFPKPYRKYVKLFSKNLKYPLQWIFIVIALFLLTYNGHFINFKSPLYLHIFKTILMGLIGWGIWRQTTNTKEWIVLYNQEFNKTFHDIAVPLLRRGVRLLIVLCMMVMVSYIWGFSAQRIVTGMGVLGIIVSLSAQDLIKNTFSAFVLLFNNVFDIGDWIQVGQTSGSVQDISLRFTKIKTYDHGVIALPNSQIADSNLTNWSRRNERLLQLQFAIDPNCSPSQLYKCINLTQNHLMLHKKIVPSSVLAQVSTQPNSSLSISYSFDLRSTDYKLMTVVQLECTRDILELFDQFGIPRVQPVQLQNATI